MNTDYLDKLFDECYQELYDNSAHGLNFGVYYTP